MCPTPLARNFEAKAPLEWLARLSDHIPGPGQHRRASPSWGRLIAKVCQVDPLVCTRCGKRMRVVAFVTDSAAIGRILDHLGLGNPEAEKPPPPLREMLRVAEHADGWGVPQEWG